MAITSMGPARRAAVTLDAAVELGHLAHGCTVHAGPDAAVQLPGLPWVPAPLLADTPTYCQAGWYRARCWRLGCGVVGAVGDVAANQHGLQADDC